MLQVIVKCMRNLEKRTQISIGKNLEKRYVAKHGKAGYSKKKVVDSNPELFRKFEKAVNLVLMEV